MSTSIIGSVPIGTETEEWRILSAEIAWNFWRNKNRCTQLSEQLRDSEDWSYSAPQFRSLIRAALRIGELENIKFRRNPISIIENNSEDWRVKTARFAWLLWLRSNRQCERIPEYRELDVWKIESQNYRNYVRDVVLTLGQSDIFLENELDRNS